tara:strand:- start:369 stop:533 length:165 start_codon:yes stop_codon:yes gene_type:complete
MYIKVTKLSKYEAEVQSVNSEGFVVSEIITYSEARALAVDMMSAAKKILELEDK